MVKFAFSIDESGYLIYLRKKTLTVSKRSFHREPARFDGAADIFGSGGKKIRRKRVK
jgi:hypothetical protein